MYVFRRVRQGDRAMPSSGKVIGISIAIDGSSKVALTDFSSLTSIGLHVPRPVRV